jgi:ribosomal protein S18 acetylase RimI-like enzyme
VSDLLIRDATEDDWPSIWSFLRIVIGAGETFTWDRDTDEPTARRRWMHEPPGVTLVAVDEAGAVHGTAEIHPNYGGPGRHVANAGFIVDPDHAGRGVGRALGTHVIERACRDGFESMVFNAVVETNTSAVALWRSLGFSVLATIPRAFDHPTDGKVGLLVMHRDLRQTLIRDHTQSELRTSRISSP